MNKDFAFILGNGITRLEVDCENLLDYGTVYGCNRIYQEFAPNVLVSTDREMAHEIQQSGYSSCHKHYTRKQNILKDSGALILPKHLHDTSSGPAALGLATLSEANYLFMIGMDLKGINNKINNVYAGTQHYKKKESPPVFFGNWVDQINNLIKMNNSKRFLLINPLDSFTADIFYKNNNFETLNLYEFKQVINNL